jgi:hypothetical protein
LKNDNLKNPFYPFQYSFCANYRLSKLLTLQRQKSLTDWNGKSAFVSCTHQGDRIGKIFASWAAFYFGHVFNVSQAGKIFGEHFPQ